MRVASHVGRSVRGSDFKGEVDRNRALETVVFLTRHSVDTIRDCLLGRFEAWEI